MPRRLKAEAHGARAAAPGDIGTADGASGAEEDSDARRERERVADRLGEKEAQGQWGASVAPETMLLMFPQ